NFCTPPRLSDRSNEHGNKEHGEQGVQGFKVYNGNGIQGVQGEPRGKEKRCGKGTRLQVPHLVSPPRFLCPNDPARPTSSAVSWAQSNGQNAEAHRDNLLRPQ